MIIPFWSSSYRVLWALQFQAKAQDGLSVLQTWVFKRFLPAGKWVLFTRSLCPSGEKMHSGVGFFFSLVGILFLCLARKSAGCKCWLNARWPGEGRRQRTRREWHLLRKGRGGCHSWDRMTVWMCCSELNVKASSSFASWADHLLLFVWSTANLQKSSGQRLTLFDFPSCIYLLLPHMSILPHSWTSGHWFWNASDQPVPVPVMAFHCHLSSKAFWELGTLCSMFFYGFPLLWRKPFRLARISRSSWLSVPPSWLLSCFGSLQWIVRRKSHYLLLTKKLFHNVESFERVSLRLCLQSRLKYVALHNLTRWQFASMYFFYFHCWILCTLCYEELGIEIANSERDTVKYWKHGGEGKASL